MKLPISILRFHQYLETILIPGLLMGLGFYFNPLDPLLVHQNFPWMWFGPVLIALRYNYKYALGATAALLLGVFYTLHFPGFSWNDYWLWLLGGLLLTVLCNSLQAKYAKQQNKYLEQLDYLNEKTGILSRDNQVLRLSHEYLEQSLIVKPITLRSALVEIRKLLESNPAVFPQEAASALLQLLAYYASLEKAGLYLMSNNQVQAEPIAWIGTRENLRVDDVFVRLCISRQKTSYITLEGLQTDKTSHYAAVVPLLTFNNQLLGLLAVTEITFLSLHQETLKTLTILLAYYADRLWTSQQNNQIKLNYSEMSSDFIDELARCLHLWSDIEVDSAIVEFTIHANSQINNIVFEIEAQRRGIDCIWLQDLEKGKRIFVLMPLAMPAVVAGYFERIKALLANKFQIELGSGAVLTMTYQLSLYKNIEQLLNDLLRKL